MKLATFAWSWTVEVPGDFDENDNDQFNEFSDEAFKHITQRDCELTDLQNKDAD